jgi:hypothetical protein
VPVIETRIAALLAAGVSQGGALSLPPWIERMLGQAKGTLTEVRYISGANLELFHQETREAMYRALVEGGYKVRQVSGSAEYVEASKVFAP